MKKRTQIMQLIIPLCLLLSVAYAQLPKRRFEYKYSLKGPHLMQKDGLVPFWTYSGSALPSDDKVRITPSLRSRKGAIWGKHPVDFEHWEVEVTFKVTGRGRVGADGLAIWYVETPGIEGPVYGSQDKWVGLGIFFDSFDNDNQRNNPYILAMSNDGTKEYDHANDGLVQQLGGCMRDFRNKPYAVRAKIEYYKNSLTVYFHNGMTNNEYAYELCMRAENVVLPKKGYFGVSAATGGLADDHDVIKFLTHSLDAEKAIIPDGESTSGHITDEEVEKFNKEFDEYYDKLQKQKDDYREKHPDVKDDYDEDDYFEDDYTRDLKVIFEGQTNIYKSIRTLEKKLDEIVGRQERTISAIAGIKGGSVSAPATPSGGPPGGSGSNIARHEVDTLLNTQNDITRKVRDLQSVIGDVQQKTAVIYSRGDSGGGKDGPGFLDHEIKDKLNQLTHDVKAIRSNPQAVASGDCPEPSCLTSLTFIIFAVAQTALFLIYFMYRSSQEAAAKKFY
ncbi:protein ERGIC-53-like isoform X2 [Apostichopus japonicus]|uniref:protein ERGIC-53-like isoform X2 n=1 Tax=Stichopus japonicus TaxID=307972 RepID=UPI003AB6F8B3